MLKITSKISKRERGMIKETIHKLWPTLVELAEKNGYSIDSVLFRVHQNISPDIVILTQGTEYDLILLFPKKHRYPQRYGVDSSLCKYNVCAFTDNDKQLSMSRELVYLSRFRAKPGWGISDVGVNAPSMHEIVNINTKRYEDKLRRRLTGGRDRAGRNRSFKPAH